MQRRLAAVLAADVVGYSRLIGEDEAFTLAELQRLRSEIFDPKAIQHRGRIVKLMGDGTLMEFASVVAAVTFAVDLQIIMRERNKDIPENRQIVYRIGINLGDIVYQDDDIYGDGVNVAARLEALAEPGGICISRSARDQVRDKLNLNLDDQGEIEVKNIARPVRVFHILIDNRAAALATPVIATAKQSIPNRRPYYVAVLAACLVLAIGVAWWQPWGSNFEPASVKRMSHPLPAKPSIAVLPFINLSDDPQQKHFVDGMTEDLITDLSKISGLFVIARSSTFAYKGRSVTIKKVAEDLGVRFVLEGSARRSGDRVRVNAQLINATTGGHIWADRYDGKVADIFSMQDMVLRKIVKALAVNLTEKEEKELALGQTANIQAREIFQKGWDSYLRYSAKDNADAMQRFKAALKIDPTYGRAHAALGLAYLRGCQMRWNKALNMSVAQANLAALMSLKNAKDYPSTLANVADSRISLYNGRYEVAVSSATRALAKDPNDPEGYIAMAWAMITTGTPEAGVELIERAMRLNPSYPNYYAFALGVAYFTMNDLEKAKQILAKAIKRDSGATELMPVLASIYAQLGQRKKAHVTLQGWKPGASQEEIRSKLSVYHFPYKWSGGSKLLDQMIDGIYVASIPAETSVLDIASALQSKDSADRLKAARLLGWLGPNAADAVPALIDALQDENRSVRKAAVVTLGNIGPGAKAAIPALTALKEEKGFIQFVANKAIQTISGK